jgi:hypothetical protein
MIKTTKLQANEIMKSNDLELINEREVKNLEAAFRMISRSMSKDLIFFGLKAQQRSTPSMNIDITLGLGVCNSTIRMAYNKELLGPIAVTNGVSSLRIDTVEIRLYEVPGDQDTRAFKDPITGAISYSSVYTTNEIKIEAQVIAGTPGSGVAPTKTSGWIKIAEIQVPAYQSTNILNSYIKNCTANYDGCETADWTTEKDITYIKEDISDLRLYGGKILGPTEFSGLMKTLAGMDLYTDLKMKNGGIGFGPEVDPRLVMYRGGTDFLILRNYNQQYSILSIWSPPGDLTQEREATISLVRGNEPNQEFVDFYNNGYNSERQFGIRIQKRGTGSFRAFVIDQFDGTTKSNILKIDADRSMELSSSLNLLDNVLSRPMIKDYSETLAVKGNSGADLTINFEDGNVQSVVLTNNCTISFTNPPATGRAGSITLIVKKDDNGLPRQIWWPVTIKWEEGLIPNTLDEANQIAIYTFITIDGGTTYYGIIGGNSFE